jgi:(S)-2-hydroxy-acid oxidase
MEDVIEAGLAVKRPEPIPAPDYWLQLYCFQNRQTTESLIRRAETAGYKAVVLTVDTPYLGKRYNEIRNKFTIPPNIQLGNFMDDVKFFGQKASEEQEQNNGIESLPVETKIGGPIPGPLKNDNGTCRNGLLNLLQDASISWEETIPWLRSVTSMKIIVKVCYKFISAKHHRVSSRQKMPKRHWITKSTQFGSQITEDVNLIHAPPPLMLSQKL